MTRILIDTNIYSLAMRGKEDIVEILRHTLHIGISAISIGEFCFPVSVETPVSRKTDKN